MVASGDPPTLALCEGERYHLFLSHVWSTAQDQVAVIKRQLTLMMPVGLQIFLDVDDLEDISRLEQYVSQSSSILIFLSQVLSVEVGSHHLHCASSLPLI
mgnify:CR=1 FL=1